VNRCFFPGSLPFDFLGVSIHDGSVSDIRILGHLRPREKELGAAAIAFHVKNRTKHCEIGERGSDLRCKERAVVNGAEVHEPALKRFLLSSEGFADPVVGEGRVLDGRLDFRHVAGCTVLRAYGAGCAWVVVGCFCAWLIDVTLQTA
jgi:hypothetical protein